ncbi:uncharacterized protein [Diadema antillarum]|uniref:uncharacterized protein n=1 Tax=Diadema antillarum TaxID=105358 RepID=UPI003A8784D0
MKGQNILSSEEKDCNRTKLGAVQSKTTEGKKLKREMILNRMSTGKKRQRSVPRIMKSTTKSFDTHLAKKLFFEESDKDCSVNTEDGDTAAAFPKTKKKRDMKFSAPHKGKFSPAKTTTSTTTWQVSQKSAPSSEVEKDPRYTEVEEEEEEEDDEIDFPLKNKKSHSSTEEKTMELLTKETQSVGAKSQDRHTTSDLKQFTKKTEASYERKASDQLKGKKSRKLSEERTGKRKHRRKKRKRLNSAYLKPSAKKSKKVLDGIAVRCGNLPAGASKTMLKMFFGEVDVFPKDVIIKTKRKVVPGQKKHCLLYSTIICGTADEADKLCALNGISMPSPAGRQEQKLLIHKMDDACSTGGSSKITKKI